MIQTVGLARENTSVPPYQVLHLQRDHHLPEGLVGGWNCSRMCQEGYQSLGTTGSSLPVKGILGGKTISSLPKQ